MFDLKLSFKYEVLVDKMYRTFRNVRILTEKETILGRVGYLIMYGKHTYKLYLYFSDGLHVRVHPEKTLEIDTLLKELRYSQTYFISKVLQQHQALLNKWINKERFYDILDYMIDLAGLYQKRGTNLKRIMTYIYKNYKPNYYMVFEALASIVKTDGVLFKETLKLLNKCFLLFWDVPV